MRQRRRSAPVGHMYVYRRCKALNPSCSDNQTYYYRISVQQLGKCFHLRESRGPLLPSRRIGDTLFCIACAPTFKKVRTLHSESPLPARVQSNYVDSTLTPDSTDHRPAVSMPHAQGWLTLAQLDHAGQGRWYVGCLFSILNSYWSQ